MTHDVRGATLHCPTVDAVVGGVETKLIVDTGATDHVLTLDVVDRAGLARTPGPSGTDAAGTDVESWEVDRPPILLGGAALPEATVPAIEGPSPFASWGVGGFLSPQRLAEEVVVVDFSRKTLEVRDTTAAVEQERISREHPGAIVVVGKRHASGTIGIEIEVPAGGRVTALFDSGAASTAVVTTAVPGAEVARTFSVGGTAIEAETLPMATLVAGAATFSLNLSVVSEMPVPDGSSIDEVPSAAVGMDLLRETMLVIPGRDVGSVLWVVPADHSALST